MTPCKPFTKLSFNSEASWSVGAARRSKFELTNKTKVALQTVERSDGAVERI
jgi:hypothetical protein